MPNCVEFGVYGSWFANVWWLYRGASYFEPLTDAGCTIPVHLTGEVYMMVTREKSIADASVVAG